MPNQRQEVLNVTLASALQRRGLVAAPEQVLRRRGGVSLPDVIVDFYGLRLAIEAEFGLTDSARAAAHEKARERVDRAIAHVGIAVCYPAQLQRTPFGRLEAELELARIEYCILSEASVTEAQIQRELFPRGAVPAFDSGTVDDLAEALRRCYDRLVEDETLGRAVAIIEASIERFIESLGIQPATALRLANALGYAAPPTVTLTARVRIATTRISALILVNALIFEEVLSQTDARVRTLQSFRTSPHVLTEIADHWAFILRDINYYPIFFTAHDLLTCFAADASVDRALSYLREAALQIVQWRASLRHDLAGRIYHRLLEEAKFLGAYYTSIPAAALLTKLALPRDHSVADWASLSSLSTLRVADLACGTGTLLMAAADAICDNYVRECVAQGIPPELQRLQHTLVEHILYGYDVLASAVHLTASTLTLRVPETPINVTHLYRVPLGGIEQYLGTLEFLDAAAATGTLFGQPEQVTGTEARRATIQLPELDVCVMNPPFTRSVGGNLLFGHLPPAERSQLREKLKRVVATQSVPASITAGLGSVFVALASKRLKPGGRLGLVLPRALISGDAWRQTRELLARDYALEYIIVSHEPFHWNFSENTSLSEVLVVAHKHTSEADTERRTTCVNLWKQPQNAIEALSIAGRLVGDEVPGLESGVGSLEISVGNRKVGEAISVRWNELSRTVWSEPCAFARTELTRLLASVARGTLVLPHERGQWKIPLTRLSDLGTLGFDRRDIHDAFNVSTSRTSYPALWGHDADLLIAVAQDPNRFLRPLTTPRENRPHRDADRLWEAAGRIMIAERLRLNTARVAAILLSEKGLSNVWWSFVLTDRRNEREREKAMALWLNSTLGLLILVGVREETEGAWVNYKKPVLALMPVLDVAGLEASGTEALASAYDELCNTSLLPLPEMGRDASRQRIDRAISDVLGFPDLSPIREMLSREPVISLDVRTLS